MKSSLRRVVATAIGLALAAVVAAAGAVEVAKARSTTGNSSITRDGQTSKVGPATQFREGDVVRVPADGDRLTVEFEDNSSITVVGPATLRFGQMGGGGRRIVLASGVISEANVRGVALEIQAPAPYDASLVLQNSRGFARVNPGDRVVFQKIEGGYAKVWRAKSNQFEDLGDAPWYLNARDGTSSAGAGPTRAPARPRPSTVASQAGWRPLVEESLPGDAAKITNGSKAIVFHPASKFTRERLKDNGVRLCFQGGPDDWGVVEIGINTTLFLAQGQCVEFDANGEIIRFDGISHIYHPLDSVLMNEEPVQDASDASPMTRHPR